MLSNLIKTDGTQSQVLPANGKTFTLSELYRLLSCELVEVVSVRLENYDKPLIAIMDEEGKLTNKEINLQATAILRLCGSIARNDYVVGDCIICESSLFE